MTVDWFSVLGRISSRISVIGNNLTASFAIYTSMRIFVYGLLALILAVPFAKPADAQVVVVVHHRHHRHHHHHHYYH